MKEQAQRIQAFLPLPNTLFTADRNELHNHFYPLPHSLGGLTSQANLAAQPRRGCKGKRPRRSCCELSEKLSTQCAPARRREVAGGAASAAATRWRVARRGVVRGALCRQLCTSCFGVQGTLGQRTLTILLCSVIQYSILVCTVYYTAEKAKFYTVCTYVYIIAES